MERSIDSALQRVNSLEAREAENELLKCCGSRVWATRLLAEGPFKNAADLIATANRVWWSLAPGDWLEAFHSHPKIGEKKAASAVAVEAQRWSEDEQAGIRNSAQETMAEVAKLNRAYEEKFG